MEEGEEEDEGGDGVFKEVQRHHGARCRTGVAFEGGEGGEGGEADEEGD